MKEMKLQRRLLIITLLIAGLVVLSIGIVSIVHAATMLSVNTDFSIEYDPFAANFVFELNQDGDNTWTVTKLADDSLDCTNIKIPSVNEGGKVTQIAANAFSGNATMTSLTIPESITEIGEGAFAQCTNLTQINFNAINCRTGADVFIFAGQDGAGIDLVFGEKTTTVPGYLFYGDDYSLAPKLKSIDFGGVQTIGAYAFYSSMFTYTGSQELIFPEGLKSIGANAFQYCMAVTKIVIPSTMESIGYNALSVGSINRIEYYATNMPDPSASLFMGVSGNIDLVIGDNVQRIPKYCFKAVNALGYAADNFVLNSIKWGKNLKEIGAEAFQYAAINELIIPSTITSIGSNAFYGGKYQSAYVYSETVAADKNMLNEVFCDVNLNMSTIKTYTELYVLKDIVDKGSIDPDFEQYREKDDGGSPREYSKDGNTFYHYHCESTT